MTGRQAAAAALALMLLGISGAHAQDPQSRDREIHLEYVKPEVITKRYHNRTVEEYRVRQNLYMMKTIPDVGSPYYLVDQRGTGELEYRRNMEQLDMQVPVWVLHRW